MTPQERAKIVNLISQEIRENGPLVLRELRNRLTMGGIPTTTITGPKKWMEANFPEFFVFGNNGYETIDFAQSPLSRFYRSLLSTVPAIAPGTQVSFDIVMRLIREAGLDPESYPTDQSVRELLKVYPSYELFGGPAPETVAPRSLAPSVVLPGSEQQFIHAIVYVNWKQVHAAMVQYPDMAAASMETIRNGLIRVFAKAIINGEGLMLDALDDDLPRIVIDTGYTTQSGDRLYGVLQPNPNSTAKQPWILAGITYPDESGAGELGQWLAKRIFGKMGISYESLNKQIDGLQELRHGLLPRLEALVEVFRTGACPESLSDELAKYEGQWHALKEAIAQIPTLQVPEDANLTELTALLEEKNEVADKIKRAVELFDAVCRGIAPRLAALDGKVPASDCETVHRLFDPMAVQTDLQIFKDILAPYHSLRNVLGAANRHDDPDSIFAVAEHFELDKVDVVNYLVGSYSTRYACLDNLQEIEHIIDECIRASACEEAKKPEVLGPDALMQLIFVEQVQEYPNWIQAYSGMFPEDAEMAAVILGDTARFQGSEVGEKLAGVPEDLTPGSIGARLLAAFGNRDRLAERYLLMGMFTDRKACVRRLLEFYREAGDEARFLTLWDSEYRGFEFTVQDACYWLSIQCKAETVQWDEIEKFVESYPEVKKSQEYQNAISANAELSGEHPVAYQRWMGMHSLELNELESAIAKNDVETVYLLLADQEKMQELGYSTEEVSTIRQTVDARLPGGMDAYGRAARLYAAQKNKNCSAECLLWAANQTGNVLAMLFEIYKEAQDCESLCWLVEKFSVPVDTLTRALVYGEALSKTRRYDALAELMRQRPEMWHESALLEGLAGEPWDQIREREKENPIGQLGPFELALIQDDRAGMEALLSDGAQMEAWGYPEELVGQMKEKLASGEAVSGTDRVSVVRRFKLYMGNVHRRMERYLYQQFNLDKNWTIQQLYALTVAESRYLDACTYYEAHPLLARADTNISKYMWCLLHLGKAEQLFEQAQLNPYCLRIDSQLTNAVLALAEQEHMQEFSEELQKMVILLPKNEFEKAVMLSNQSQMQKYISDPAMLSDLGYSAESIARFKDRISKPMPYRSDKFSLAVRMRSFFGNERAIPFFLDMGNDDRAAKALMDIYFATQRWSDACTLYREYLPANIWNSTYEQRYLEALSRSHTQEDCQLYLAYLQSDSYPDRTSAAYQWRYLRCMIGTHQEAAALQQMQVLLAGDYTCAFDVVPNVFDLVWKVGSASLRQQTALFAARIYLEQMHTMSLDNQKILLSLNGNLLREEDHGSWVQLFRENDLEAIATFLMCYFNYGVGNDPTSLQATGDALFALLDDPDEQHESSILTAVTRFALDNELLGNIQPEQRQLLLSRWLELLMSQDEDSGLLQLEQLNATEFTAFYDLWKTVELSQAQMQQVNQACFRDLEGRGTYTAAFFQRILTLTAKTQEDPGYVQQYAGQLAAAFITWFGTIREEETNEVKTASLFLRDACLDYDRMKRFVEACAEQKALYEPLVRNAILARCDRMWPDIRYSYLQALYFHTEQEDMRLEALSQAQQLLHTGAFEIGTDSQSLQFVYHIVCTDPVPENLHVLQALYQKAGKDDQAAVVAILEATVYDNADQLRVWFHRILEERPLEWIEQYAKWWAPLVRLSETDRETKGIISYLSDDEASMQSKGSVLRLLLSDLYNAVYIGCYLQLETELPAAAYGKLTYIRALRAPAACADAIRECIAKKQYVYAIKLLTTRIKTIPSNAVFIGQTMGDIYTEESVSLCPELVDYVPAAFRCIIRLNLADQAGIWKNIGRAVDIAILTKQEGMFLDIFNQDYKNMYVSYPGKCAAIVASLMLRHEFETAKHYIQQYYEGGRMDQYLYMELLSSLIDECLQTNALSQENEILVRSVPVNGNMRSLEVYGGLVEYALRKQCIQACARAFYRLRDFAPKDKALLGSCVQLYSAVVDTYSIAELYAVARSYLENVQESQVVRLTKSLAAISACIGDEVSDVQLLSDCRSRIPDDKIDEDGRNPVWKNVRNLRWACIRFLENAPDDEGRKEFLIRAATGWWKLDKRTLGYFRSFQSLFDQLVEINPISFYSACLVAVLQNRDDAQFCLEIKEQFSLHGYAWGKEQADNALHYPEALREEIIGMLDAPVDLPGLYTNYLSQVVADPDDDRFIKLMSMLMVVQRNFLNPQYEANICGLKEMVAACTSERQMALSRLILAKTVRADGNILRPKDYVNAGAYEMSIIAAEKQMNRPNLTEFFKRLNGAYMDLGKFMVEPPNSKKYNLGQLMNMATVLCQSNSYEDIEKLMAVAPAKWKLCLRSVQEFIQGNPRNVLYLLNNKDFRIHEGCFRFVYYLAKSYPAHLKWSENFAKENSIRKRSANFGQYDLTTVANPPEANSLPVLLVSPNRNSAKLKPYREVVDEYLLEMIEDDRRNAQNTPQRAEQAGAENEEITLPGETAKPGGTIWEIPYIAECLERSLLDEQQGDETAENQEGDAPNSAEGNGRKSWTKAELIQALNGRHNDAEIIKLCSNLLVLMRQEPVTQTTKRYSAMLGFALYHENCQRKGMATYATEESRNILYSMVPCLDGVNDQGTSLKVCLRQCLESYQNLSEFTSDCMGDAMISLCDIIAKEDKEAAECLKNHILFAREIGQKMREHKMTNEERLKWLQECLSYCRSVENPVEKRAKEALAAMLNQEIRMFRNKARIYLEVYNEESVMGYGCIFGKVENLGSEAVSKLTLTLTIDGIFKGQCTLPVLDGSEMVPFALPCDDDGRTESLSYKLVLKYVTIDGTEETTQPVEGVLTLKDPGQVAYHYQTFDASNPADSDNYIERISITNTLEANYLVDGGFRRFPNCAIYGMKRSGKSSVLRRLGRLFKENYPDEVCYIIVSCEGITGNFYERTHALFVKYVMDELNAKFNFDSREGWKEFRENWETPPEAIGDFRWLDSFYVALRHQWMPDKGLVIMADEIERLYFDLGEDDSYLAEDSDSFVPQDVDFSNAQSVLWNVINKMTQREDSRVRFVLCGSDFFTSKIIAEGDNLTQFFQKGKKLNVDRMKREEIAASLRTNPTIELHEDTINYLWDIANGLPWHPKMFCNAVIENQLIQEEACTRGIIYPSDIQDAIDMILSTTKDIASPANFGLLSLTPEEELIVHTVADALDSRQARISPEDLMDRIQQAAKDESKDSLYMKARADLVTERKLLELDRGSYRFGCELYRMFLRHELPPRFL